MSELQRGRAGRAPFAPRHLLLLLALSEVRLRAEQPSRAAPVSEVRGAVSAGEGNEARRAHRVLQQSRLRLPRADCGDAKCCERITSRIRFLKSRRIQATFTSNSILFSGCY